MSSPISKIVVAGDLRIDRLVATVPAAIKSRNGLNWQRRPGVQLTTRPGGALLLAQMARQAAGCPVSTYDLGVLDAVSPEEAILSVVDLAPLPYAPENTSQEPPVYRVKEIRGFAGPSDPHSLEHAVEQDDPEADLVILDDAGNGFRDAPARWPAALGAEGAKPLVILRMRRPVGTGALWEDLRRAHADRLVVVVDADDLRAEGVQISRALSWERTATDLVWQLASNPELSTMINGTHLIVRFGLEGALYHCRDEGALTCRLYYDPLCIEGGFQAEHPGDMLGCGAAFVAALSARIATGGIESIGESVREGIRSARRLLRLGFGTDPDRLEYPGAEELFSPAGTKDALLSDVQVPRPTAPTSADLSFWCVLEEKRKGCLEDIAYEMVRRGDAGSLKGVPVGQFSHLRTVDRAEIESFRSIQNLMREYMAKPAPGRPLSIAVFGPPGSGKSFGVKQVARSIVPGRVEAVEFNVSQFESSTDLISALHRVRDHALEGTVPLVFFDEFDSHYEGRLGWLKYFLAPMQDGSFRDGDSIHPIGKAIFVFAGGTCARFEDFSAESADGDGTRRRQTFVDAKGPDFVSRLRGYINILGPNPQGESDDVFVIRRAIILRSLLERKAGHLLDAAGTARIDEGVLRAMIKVPRYKHGVRSMEAILDMSSLAGHDRFEQAALPLPAQLELHVDAEVFSRLVVRDVLFGGAREALARAIHERFRRNHADRPDDDPAMQPWEELREDLKESNRLQADHIPVKLRAIQCGFAPASEGEPNDVTFTDEEIETMAEMEHERWMAEKRLDGYVDGEERDHDAKTSPYLVPWEELSEEVKEWDLDAVRAIPELMADAGFEIYRC